MGLSRPRPNVSPTGPRGYAGPRRVGSAAKGGRARARRPLRVVTIPVPTPFPVGPVNAFLLDGDPLTLIDTGPQTPEAREALTAGLRSAGYAPEDLRRVLLTHGHHDHFGLAAWLGDASGARLLGGRLDGRHFRMERGSRPGLERLTRAGFGLSTRFALVAALAAIDRYGRPLAAWDELTGGEVLPGDGWTVRVRSTPGHTPGSLTFEVPEAGLLFTGDTVLRDITPNAIVDEDPESPGETFRSVTRYFRTLEEIRQTSGGARLKTGHGQDIPDYAEHHRRIADRNRRRIAQIEAALSAGARTVRDLVVAVFPRLATVNVYLAFSEILGFLMYLEDRGRVEKREGPSLDEYRLLASPDRPASRWA